ncbi:hypothetical protein [Nitrosophilus labii]|uniref:hypothetical protein n=1 Tax=Nitrosophilus labii TaxID=2706014 RepID=UPI001656BBD1|nr:hypothetical protein [Nitrosophilus labii]
MDKVFLAIQKKEYDKLLLLSEEIKSIDFINLNEEEKVFLKNAVDEMIIKAKESQSEIVKSIKDKESLKKYNI